jgi:hypothetical protein
MPIVIVVQSCYVPNAILSTLTAGGHPVAVLENATSVDVEQALTATGNRLRCQRLNC